MRSDGEAVLGQGPQQPLGGPQLPQLEGLVEGDQHGLLVQLRLTQGGAVLQNHRQWLEWRGGVRVNGAKGGL